ncbi:MAG: hypothetical protein ACOH1R_07965 [Luteimonas sp.]
MGSTEPGAAIPAALVCRTVLDLRCRDDKYISQTLLLAAGWHRHCAHQSVLEVLCVGGTDPLLSAFLDELSATSLSCEPGPNDDFSLSSNKIQGATPDWAARRVLLVDNDVCFLSALDGLAQIPAGSIAASEAGNLRVSTEQWELISRTLGLPLLRRPFHPLNRRPLARGQDQVSACIDGETPVRPIYLNSGVVLFPAGHDHRNQWLAHQRMIHSYFRGHVERSEAVDASDQAALATSIAAHGAFDWLPLRFNYRYGGFRHGLEPADRIAIAHLTGDVADSHTLDMAARIEAYWQKFILSKINVPSPDTIQADHRTDIALSVRNKLLELVRDYDLERWLSRFRSARSRPQR